MCVKVVYVVLEAQYQSSLSAAVKRANATNDKVWHPPRRAVHSSVTSAAGLAC